MQKFKGVLALIFVAVTCNVLACFFFFSFFRFAYFCVCFLMVSKLTGRNSQVWSYLPTRWSLKHGIVLFALRNDPQLRAEGKREERGAGAEALFSGALTLSGGVTGL